MSILDITIVITSFKSSEKIIKCLNSINSKCKVLVVKNSNDMDFKNNIEKEFSNIECILTGNNLGYGKANNIGLKKVKTKFALILNPDTLLHKSTLENFIKATKEIKSFAIMAPYIQTEQDKNIEEKRLSISVNNVKGFAMFLNMPEFKDIGFFDERFFIYFEEIDLCKRIVNSNKKIYLIPEIKIEHFGGMSHNKNVEEEMEVSRNWHWMWSSFSYHRKYKGFLFSSLIFLPKLFSVIFKTIFHTLIFNKEKKKIYYHRFLGLINAMAGKNSWYRPNV